MKDELLIPYVGMPVTYQIGTDSYGYEISKVTKSLKTIWLKADHGHKKDVKCTLRSCRIYRPAKAKAGIIFLGFSRDYLDPGF